MERLRAKKAAILSLYALPEEARPLVTWAVWLAERVPSDDVEIRFHETPQRPIRLSLSQVGGYVARVLGSLSLLQAWEAAAAPDRSPGWRPERIHDLCTALTALREALRPLGLADIRDDAS
jgi:hypothetical protein